MLLLMRQHWRASINRFAEAMTHFRCRDRRPVPDHASRPAAVFLLARSISQHDDGLAAVAQRADLGFLGDPELSPVLDHLLVRRACSPTSPRCAIARASAFARRFYGALALGWRGSARHWHVYHVYQMTMAALAVPLVVSLHSVVGFDFAASLMPGWQETIFPPYFVVGAMYSGFAMVVTSGRAGALGLRAAGADHDRAFQRHGEGPARVRDHHGPLLRDRVVHGLVRRRARRPRSRCLHVHRPVCAALLRAAVLQRACPAGVLVHAPSAATSGPCSSSPS